MWTRDTAPPRPGVPSPATERATLVLAPNANAWTFEGTNTWLLAEPGSDVCAVLDPGPDDDAHLAAILAAAGDRRIVAVLVTHAHHDHAELAPAVPTPSTSIALIGTSTRCGPSLNSWPTTMDAATRPARLHQVNPTAATTSTARATPATTLATRWTPLSRVLVRVACTTRSAVRAAMIGGGSCSPTSWAMRKAATVAPVIRPARKAADRPRVRTRSSRSAAGRGRRSPAPPLRRVTSSSSIPRPGRNPRDRRTLGERAEP